MAQMERNVNLEEIDSDALFGIDALKGQSIWQKIVFWGALILGVLINVLLPNFFDTPRLICIFIFLILILLGIAFGCNYTKDLTYGKYLYLYFFKPVKRLYFKSSEDSKRIKEKALALQKEEDDLLRKEKGKEAPEQKKLLIKLITFMIVVFLFVLSILFVSRMRESSHIHHEVSPKEVQIENK